MVPHPAQSPLRRGPRRCGFFPDGRHFRRRGWQSQVAAPERLHDHHSQAFGGGVTQPLRAGLVFLVEIIVLDLAEFPGVGVHDPLEIRQPAVEGEAGVDNAAVGLGFVQEIDHLQGFKLVPGLPGQGVQQVVVDALRPDLLQLGVEVGVHVPAGFDHPGGQLGGDPDLVAISVGQGSPHDGFALSGVVGPGRIQVVDPSVDGAADLADGPRFVDLPVSRHGESHQAEPQNGQLISRFWHFPVEHMGLL